MTTIPVLPIKSTVIFPGTTSPLRVGRVQSIAAIRSAQNSGGWILAVSQKHDTDERNVKADDVFKVGTLSKIEKVRGDEARGFQVILRGDKRFSIDDFQEKDGHLWATGSESMDVSDIDTPTYQALLSSLKEMSQKILELLPSDTRRLMEVLTGIEDLSFLTHLCAANLEIDTNEKQKILEQTHLKKRVLSLLEIMQKQRDELEVQVEIRDKLSQKMGKQQREAILREQMRTIREELGDSKGGDENDDYRKKFDEIGMPAEVRKIALDRKVSGLLSY